ncbi:flagellar basal-body rod protein FlgC [Quadrisphaera granulorum]|uniref:Flagellar basal-body rod protein FlgC n=1 Tax=Quadrisphaera granulorum TaxID=317664 RepID=A0A316AR89_9ACTN|nr:flagellar basal body rod C-terminal domain-containing protein [Quadrisphaera granulorum]PWJ52597.1 flagellar basal-body rod protein FlgC [Quadrisphaera granulorum]SZE97647.1 flagellar basal-body rod protein FlgC [Quadrisphaera granulorum]
MGLFDAIGAAGSGMTVARKWMDAISDNLSNMNTATRTNADAFRQRFVTATSVQYGAEHGNQAGGVRVTGVAFGKADGRMVHEPDNPLADENGYVKYPDIDLASQMGQLIMTQRAYQANAAVVDRAKSSYEAALQIGKK